MSDLELADSFVPLQSYLLDPLSVIIKLAILGNKPIGTKLLIKDNVIYFQEPGPFQSLCRILYKSTKDDIQYLYNPINIACIHFLSKANGGATANTEKSNRIKKLFQFAQQGIKNLIETYSSSHVVVIALNYYYILLTNHIEQTYNSNMFVSDTMSAQYNSTLCDSLNEKWDDEKTKVVLGLINYLTKTDVTNIKLLETFMENVDTSTKLVVSQL